MSHTFNDYYDSMLDIYNCTLADKLNKHAMILNTTNQIKPKSLWCNTKMHHIRHQRLKIQHIKTKQNTDLILKKISIYHI